MDSDKTQARLLNKIRYFRSAEGKKGDDRQREGAGKVRESERDIMEGKNKGERTSFTIPEQIDEAQGIPEAVFPVENIRSESTLEGGHGQQQ